MKHLKLYEEFDLDKFLEDPEGNIHDDDDPEIGIGDWVTSYRGIGQVMEILPDGLTKIQLVDTPRSIVKIPLENATKIKKEEADIAMSRIPETLKELKSIEKDLDVYSEAIGAYDGEPHLNDVESSIEFLEEVLIKVIELKQKDPYTIYHKEYSGIIMTFANLVDIAMHSTDDAELKKKLEKIDNDFYQISE
jgi:hypothetical protein